MPELTIKINQQATHNWPGAPERRNYLRRLHEHTFQITAGAIVRDLDRELEFHDLRDELKHAVHGMLLSVEGAELKTFGSRSCEHIAAELVRKLKWATWVHASEDGDFGAVVKADEHSRPPLITVCGSTRFKDETLKVIADLELQGWAVLSVGSYMHAEGITFDDLTKRKLDLLHQRKIAMSDAIYVVNVGGYIGESTRAEINLAMSLGRPIIYLEPDRSPKTCDRCGEPVLPDAGCPCTWEVSEQ